jgi:hypothetical protein
VNLVKKHRLPLVRIVIAVGAFGLFGPGSAFAAHLRHAPGPVAAMLKNGAVYVTATTDDYWHQVSPKTLSKLGYTRNDITWYGRSLPGTIAPQTTSPASRIARMSRPPVNLAGVLGTGRIYIARGDLFYPITRAALLKRGYSVSWVKWFGSLPGSIAASS